MYRRFLTAMILISWILALLLAARPVQAAGIAVTTTADEFLANGNCSLREAIVAANTSQIVDQCDGRAQVKDILLQPGQTYTLTRITPGGAADSPENGDLDILSGMTLTGDLQNRPVIDAAVLGDRVLHIKSPQPVILNGVEIRGGSVETGIWRGGGIYIEMGEVYMHSVTVSENFSKNVGGGIFINSGAALTFYNGLIIGNEAVHGGGVFSYGTFTMIASSLMNNVAASGNESTGAGLANNAQGGATARLVNSTVAGNRNNNIYSPSTNPYISAGIYSAARLVLENVTIVDNQGIGLQLTNSPLATTSIIKNTIIARQQAGANCALPSGASIALQRRHNLADDTSCYLEPPFDVLTAKGASGVGLIPEGFGTQTLMYGLLTGSPAIAMGENCQAADQRGLMRPAACDIGSFELDATEPFSTWQPLIIR